MPDLSPDRLAELERLLVLATEGPYPLHKSERWKIRERATALIAERTALLAERKRLRAENERLREALDEVESRSALGAISERPFSDLAGINAIARAALAAPTEGDTECDGSASCAARVHILGCFAGPAEGAPDA